MLPYGSRKRGPKLHPHNKCGICGENKVVKARERSKSRLIDFGDEDIGRSEETMSYSRLKRKRS